MPWALDLAGRCYDMQAGILRHLPEPGGALEQPDLMLDNMIYALKTWQIDRKKPSDHTEDDFRFMREVVKPERLRDA